MGQEEVPILPVIERELIPEIRFLAEQNGAAEQQFENAVLPVLVGSVNRAYLARVQYPHAGLEAVALCLRTTVCDEALVQRLGAVFAPLFRPEVHLDIICLTDEQEEMVRRVCRPFFASDR